MIEYSYNVEYQLDIEILYTNWLNKLVKSERKFIGELHFIFCDDEYLLELNKKYLNHDTYTDIISFDYTKGNKIGGDIFISIDRIKENALEYNASFDQELRRVMAHGILHLLGYNDKTENEKVQMRNKEEEKMGMFHVEQS